MSMNQIIDTMIYTFVNVDIENSIRGINKYPVMFHTNKVHIRTFKMVTPNQNCPLWYAMVKQMKRLSRRHPVAV